MKDGVDYSAMVVEPPPERHWQLVRRWNHAGKSLTIRWEGDHPRRSHTRCAGRGGKHVFLGSWGAAVVVV
jgi:hypothetical protein